MNKINPLNNVVFICELFFHFYSPMSNYFENTLNIISK
jgi:hypothetical protein